MEKLKFNPDNKKYYSEEFIKGFECGVERQFNADMAEKTAEWLPNPDDMAGSGYFICSNCKNDVYETSDYCPNCGAIMKGVEQ
jgi:hypothetical protein